MSFTRAEQQSDFNWAIETALRSVFPGISVRRVESPKQSLIQISIKNINYPSSRIGQDMYLGTARSHFGQKSVVELSDSIVPEVHPLPPPIKLNLYLANILFDFDNIGGDRANWLKLTAVLAGEIYAADERLQKLVLETPQSPRNEEDSASVKWSREYLENLRPHVAPRVQREFDALLLFYKNLVVIHAMEDKISNSPCATILSFPTLTFPDRKTQE